MTDEPLTLLGNSLRAEYQSWLVRLVPPWPDGFFRLAIHDCETLARIDAEFTRLLRWILEWLALDDWLSSGFFPMPADTAGFDPTAAGDFPRAPVGASWLAKDAVGGKPAYSRASSRLQESGKRVTSVTDDPDAAARRTIPLPADSADTAAIVGSESAVLPTTAGSKSGFSAGGLQDLARMLQADSAVEVGIDSIDESLVVASPFQAQTAGSKSAGMAAFAGPVPSQFARADLSPFPAGSESAEIYTTDWTEQTVPVATSATAAAMEDAAGFSATDLRRLEQELAIDHTDSPAGAIASLAPAPGPAPVSSDWRKRLSILPLRREIFVAPSVPPGSAGVPAGKAIGDDERDRAMPELVQHNAATGIPAKPNDPAATAPDLYDLLEALSREIQREYQRFYGPG